ncbi:MAG: HutD family protein [Hyphomicrobiales bacterium]|nr:HutD family protein [Hyphomicrobiales bacterium]
MSLGAIEQKTVHRITLDQQKEMPWKNGGGRTRELWKVEDDEGVLWRASIATINASGPFSIFPGCDRIIAVIAGHPVLLKFADGENLALKLFEPRTFSCERPVSAVVTEESRDLNMIWRRDQLSVDHASILVRDTVEVQMRRARWHFLVGFGSAIAVTAKELTETLAPGEAILFENSNNALPLNLHLSSELAVAFAFSIMERVL